MAKGTGAIHRYMQSMIWSINREMIIPNVDLYLVLVEATPQIQHLFLVSLLQGGLVVLVCLLSPFFCLKAGRAESVDVFRQEVRA